VINWFYAAALMCAKCIVRDEPWMAKMRDWDLKTQLLQMIEWDHKARHGWDYDTWYRGAHMREWIDDEIMKALDKCWADFSLENTASALLACVTLFDRLTQRTARALHVSTFISAAVHREIDRVLNLSRRAPA
jgi:aminoglycoside 6-adenylyltransferase